MPVDFSFCLERNFIYARWFGDVDFDQVMAGIAAYRQDINYIPGRPELVDLSAVTHADINFGTVKTILREVNDQVPGQKVTTKTVIYSPHETLFGMGRMYQTLADLAGGITVSVHRMEAEALLDLDLRHTHIRDMLSKEILLPACPRGS